MRIGRKRTSMRARGAASWAFACVALGALTMGAAGSFGGPTDALPPVPFPAENPFSEAKRALGKILFWDEQLSSDNTVACATCHQSEFGGTDPRRVRHPGVDQVANTADDIFGSPGLIRQTSTDNYERDPSFNFNARVTGRNAQGVVNSAYTPLAFWDGRASSTFIDPETGQVAIATGGALESQVVGPPVNDVEMAHGSRNWSQIAVKLRSAVPLALATNIPSDIAAVIQSQKNYPALFAAAFGDGSITARRIAFAIATYERTLIADQTDWDAFQAGNTGALSTQEQTGFNEMGVHNCLICHSPPLFSNVQPANPPTPTGAMFRNIGLRPPGDDSGRQAITGIAGDARRFKVPSLRNAALKTSFTHTGQFTTLQQIVNFYTNGVAQFPQNRDPLLPIAMSAADQAAIVAFLTGGLVDPRVANATFPFDHPTLFTSRPNTSVQEQGVGTAGSGGIIPQWIANNPPNVGNTGFKVGVRQGLVSATARLHISLSPPVNNIVPADEVVGPGSLADGGPELGYGTGHWPIPAIPALNGRVYYMQWVIDDPGAPSGQSRSAPLRVEIFCGAAPIGCPCYANCDNSSATPMLNALDFGCFLNKFAAGDPSANCDGSTASPTLNALDFSCFLTRFASGC